MVATTLRDTYGLVPRVLVRESYLQDPNWQPPAGMDVVTGDFDDAASLDAALQDIEAVFLVSPVHPEMRNREGAVAAAVARAQSSAHIVKISGLGTRLDSFVDSGRWHAEIESDIKALGLTATCLRPLFFMQNLGFQAAGMRDTGVLRSAVADAGIAMVDARDIAEVAAAVLLGGTDIEGQAVAVTGARTYTYAEVAAAASVALEREVTFVQQTLEETRTALEKSGQPQWHIDILLQFNEAFTRGWGSGVADTVSTVLRREPRGLADYLQELAEPTASTSTTGSDPFPS